MNIFIHYLDKELLDIYSTTRYTEDIVNKVSLSIKVAILLVGNDEGIYIPVSNYFEADLAKIVLERFRDIIELGFIKLVSSSKTLKSFVEKKKIVYPTLYNEDQTIEEEKILTNNVPGIWTSRNNSATSDIISSWMDDIDSSFWEELYEISNYKKISTFEKDIAAVPQKLQNKAFIVKYVLPFIKVNINHMLEAQEIINKVITKYYISSFLKEYNAVCFKNFFLIPQANEIIPEDFNHIDYSLICRRLVLLEYNNKPFLAYLNECDNFKLLLLRERGIVNEIIDGNSTKKIVGVHKGGEQMKAFIVHGHDETAKLELKDYLQNSLKMEEPIILAEQASGGLTIIEKFEKYSEECSIVFILLTPDDKYSEDDQSRARQNVIFEMGYFLGKLGRKSGRVILLYKGKLDLPNDISGLTYIKIDGGIKAAGEEIRKEIDNLQHS